MRINKSSEYFTVPEVAVMFGVTRHTVYRWIREGRLPASKKGQWKITKADVEAIIESQREHGMYYTRE